MNNFILNIKDFALNFVDDITRAFKTNELSGNEEIVRKNLTLVNNVTKDDYLDKKYTTKAKAELVHAKKHVILHKDDYIAYYRNAYLKETIEYEDLYIPKQIKREDYIKKNILKKNYSKTRWVIGIASFFLLAGFNLTFATILAVVNAYALPYFYELYHKPYQEGKKQYQRILDNIEDKLDTIIEKESLEKNESNKRVAELSLKIAECLDLINKEPYPNCIREQEALIKLNAKFLKDEEATKALPQDSLKPKLVFVSYESCLDDIRRIILENQKIYRSKKLVEERSGLDITSPVLDTGLPEVKEVQTLKRYRRKN